LDGVFATGEEAGGCVVGIETGNGSEAVAACEAGAAESAPEASHGIWEQAAVSTQAAAVNRCM
jgi:hypothetical protein